MTTPPATKRGVIPLLVALVADVVLWVSFTNGISAALDGSGSGAGIWSVVFLVALVFLLIAGAIAITRLFRRESVVVNVITTVLFAVPVAILLWVWATNR
jgi:membrane protease YdiL (CAAX protease family)